MTTVLYQNNKNTISNNSGFELNGSFTQGLCDGINPKELLEASLAHCMSITLKKLLERDNLLQEDTEFSIEVTAAKDEGGANRFSSFQVKIAFPEHLSPEYRNKAMLIVERGCTISNTLKNISAFEIETM